MLNKLFLLCLILTVSIVSSELVPRIKRGIVVGNDQNFDGHVRNGQHAYRSYPTSPNSGTIVGNNNNRNSDWGQPNRQGQGNTFDESGRGRGSNGYYDDRGNSNDRGSNYYNDNRQNSARGSGYYNGNGYNSARRSDYNDRNGYNNGGGPGNNRGYNGYNNNRGYDNDYTDRSQNGYANGVRFDSTPGIKIGNNNKLRGTYYTR